MTIKGPAAQGQAGVLGTGVNPLSVYMQYQQRRAQNEYLQYQEERKKRDKLFDYVGTYNPDAKWEQYQAEVNNMAQTEVRDWTANELNSGRDANQIQAELGFRQGRVKSFAAETGVWKTTHDDAYKTITGDAKYNEEATSALNDIFFNANGGKRTPDEVRRDIQGIDHGIIFNPKFFNETVVAKKFMDTLEEQVRTTWGTIPKADGTYMTSQEIQGKLPYQYDKDGVIMLDHHTLKPLMKMTDDLYTLVKGSQDMRLLMESKGGDTRAGQEEYLKRLLPGLDKSSVKETVEEGFKKTEGEIGRQEAITDTNQRFERYEAIATGFRPDLLKAITFESGKTNKAEYINKAGQSLVDYDEKTKSYITEGGQTTAQPPIKVRVSFTKGGLTEDLALMHANNERESGQITKDEYETKVKEIAAERGKLHSQEFGITTKTGRRTLHGVLNAMEDDKLSPKERIGEKYMKKVSEHYDAPPSKKDDPLGLFHP